MKKLILLACLGFSGAVLGHHSTLGFFDPTQRIEIEGVLTAITWANPHVRFEMDVTNEDGSVEGWHIETSAWSALRTRGLTQDFMQVGDRVRIAGPPSRDGSPEMNGRNVLLEDGTEVVMALTAEPYFTDPAGCLRRSLTRIWRRQHGGTRTEFFASGAQLSVTRIPFPCSRATIP